MTVADARQQPRQQPSVRNNDGIGGYLRRIARQRSLECSMLEQPHRNSVEQAVEDIWKRFVSLLQEPLQSKTPPDSLRTQHSFKDAATLLDCYRTTMQTQPLQSFQTLRQKTECLLVVHLFRARRTDIAPEIRRSSFVLVQNLLRHIDGNRTSTASHTPDADADAGNAHANRTASLAVDKAARNHTANHVPNDNPVANPTPTAKTKEAACQTESHNTASSASTGKSAISKPADVSSSSNAPSASAAEASSSKPAPAAPEPKSAAEISTSERQPQVEDLTSDEPPTKPSQPEQSPIATAPTRPRATLSPEHSDLRIGSSNPYEQKLLDKWRKSFDPNKIYFSKDTGTALLNQKFAQIVKKSILKPDFHLNTTMYPQLILDEAMKQGMQLQRTDDTDLLKNVDTVNAVVWKHSGIMESIKYIHATLKNIVEWQLEVHRRKEQETLERIAEIKKTHLDRIQTVSNNLKVAKQALDNMNVSLSSSSAGLPTYRQSSNPSRFSAPSTSTSASTQGRRHDLDAQYRVPAALQLQQQQQQQQHQQQQAEFHQWRQNQRQSHSKSPGPVLPNQNQSAGASRNPSSSDPTQKDIRLSKDFFLRRDHGPTGKKLYDVLKHAINNYDVNQFHQIAFKLIQQLGTVRIWSDDGRTLLSKEMAVSRLHALMVDGRMAIQQPNARRTANYKPNPTLPAPVQQQQHVPQQVAPSQLPVQQSQGYPQQQYRQRSSSQLSGQPLPGQPQQQRIGTWRSPLSRQMQHQQQQHQQQTAQLQQTQTNQGTASVSSTAASLPGQSSVAGPAPAQTPTTVLAPNCSAGQASGTAANEATGALPAASHASTTANQPAIATSVAAPSHVAPTAAQTSSKPLNTTTGQAGGSEIDRLRKRQTESRSGAERPGQKQRTETQPVSSQSERAYSPCPSASAATPPTGPTAAIAAAAVAPAAASLTPASVSAATSVVNLPPAVAPIPASARDPASTAEAASCQAPTEPIQREPVPRPEPLATRIERMVVPEDPPTNSFSHALFGRPACKLQYTKHTLPKALSFSVGSRLHTWDPNWLLMKPIAVTCTSPVDSIWVRSSRAGFVRDESQYRTQQARSAPTSPKTAVSVKMRIGKNILELLRSSARASHNTYQDGDLRVLVRMLPLEDDMSKQKQNRADCHLWPIGTFLAIDSFPVRVRQRKQQSHDRTQWLYLSDFLDLTETLLRLAGPSTSSDLTVPIDICCYDTNMYLLNIALCEYRSPETVFRAIQGLGRPEGSNLPPRLFELRLIRKMTLEESKARAMRFVQRHNIAILDSDEEGEAEQSRSEEAGKFVFSLKCAISQQIMQTPVRGTQCKHFQCFDLFNFLSSNKKVCGARWRCASCDLFLSYKDLEICGLTSAALRRFETEASPTRDRVEFRSDGDYVLLPPNKKRYKVKAPPSASSAAIPLLKKPATEEITIID